MRRTILTLALAAGMVLGGASVALAHPQDEAGFKGQAAPASFESEPALTGFGHANANGQAGLIQGFVLHAPTCAGHDTSFPGHPVVTPEETTFSGAGELDPRGRVVAHNGTYAWSVRDA